MLKNILFQVSLFCFGASFLSAQLPDPLPDQFKVTQRWLSWASDFDIETDEYKLGYVHRKLFSWTMQYDFYDIYDQPEASAKARWFSWGATFDVVDNCEASLGTIEEKIFTFFPTFEIFSPVGRKLAVAKLNFWGTRYLLKDAATDQVLATLSRPFFRWKDDWVVTIQDQAVFRHKQIDPRLFILVAAFQSDREAWERQRRAINQWNDCQYCLPIKKELPAMEAASNDDFLDKFHVFLVQLRAYRGVLTTVEPSEEDFEQVDLMTTLRLQSSDALLLAEKTSQTKKIVGLQILLPLLDSDELTAGQKNALYLLMERSAEEVSKLHVESISANCLRAGTSDR